MSEAPSGLSAALPPRLIVMALEVEGRGVFERQGVQVLYTGLGKVNAAIALTRRLAAYRHAAACAAVHHQFWYRRQPSICHRHARQLLSFRPAGHGCACAGVRLRRNTLRGASRRSWNFRRYSPDFPTACAAAAIRSQPERVSCIVTSWTWKRTHTPKSAASREHDSLVPNTSPMARITRQRATGTPICQPRPRRFGGPMQLYDVTNPHGSSR